MARPQRRSPAPHATLHGRDLVLLDEAGGAYFCLPNAATAVRPGEAAGVLRITDPNLADLLREAGMLRADRLLVGPGDRLTRATHDLSDIAPSPANWRDGAAFARSWARVAANYHGRPFQHLVDTARRGRTARHPPAASGRLIEAVAAFRRWAPWAPFQGQCLYRSYALLHWLRRQGMDAHWVFGVQTWPFAAHCWLQVEALVLDDAAEATGAYSPILVV